jgi:hypothetical protein
MIKSMAGRRNRPGVACVLAIAVLAILGIIMGILLAQGLSGRRMAERRSEQLQTLWLARSGVEMGAARLVDEPLYTGDVIGPVPGSLVTVKVLRRGDEYIVASEARYAVETSAPLVRRLERHYRLMGTPGRRYLQVSGSEL